MQEKGRATVRKLADSIDRCKARVNQRIATVKAVPREELWHGCLFWSFWLSLASFPVGYGAREVLPLVSLVFLVLYYREAWPRSVLARLRVRPLFYCLWGMVAIGVLLSEHVWVSLLHAGTGINKGFILPFIAMECVRDEKSLCRLVWASVLACFWEGLDGLYQAITGADIIFGYTRNGGRLTGSLGDYTVGNYIALALIPAFSLWFILRRALSPAATALLWFAALWPAFFLLAGASSRSGALAVAAAVGLWAVLRSGAAPGKRMLASLCVWVAVLFAVLALQGRFDVQAVENDGRWSLWRLGWSVFLEHPWFGAGAGRYNEAFRALGLVPAQDAITISHPHNLYLDMLYAHGLVGFTLGMIFLLGFLCWGWRHIRPQLLVESAQGYGCIYWRLAAWFWIGFAGWLFNGIFGHDFYRIWWLALAMSHLGIMIGAVVNGPEVASGAGSAARPAYGDIAKSRKANMPD